MGRDGWFAGFDINRATSCEEVVLTRCAELERGEGPLLLEKDIGTYDCNLLVHRP